MEDMESKLGAILGNPEMMQQITKIALVRIVGGCSINVQSQSLLLGIRGYGDVIFARLLDFIYLLFCTVLQRFQ